MLMKLSRLLVLSALCLIGQSAIAADFLEREEPVQPSIGPGFGDSAIPAEAVVKTPATLEYGKCYVLYNKDAEKYFCDGNEYGTRASVGEKPIMVRFKYEAETTRDQGKLIFLDYPKSKNQWKNVFFEDNARMFVDRASQPNYYWQVIAKEGDPTTYRLQASNANPTLTADSLKGYVGLDITTSATNTALNPALTEGENHLIDWQFFEVKDDNVDYTKEWSDYLMAKEAYDMAAKLKTLIETAESEGADFSAALEAYNTPTLSEEELYLAIIALNKVRSDWAAQQATPENPRDFTMKIVNPDYDNNSKSGWTIAYPDGGSNYAVSYDVAESFGINFYYYQDLTELPTGVFALKAKGFYRAGDINPAYKNWKEGGHDNLKLYAISGTDSLTKAVTNIYDGASEEKVGKGNESTPGGVTPEIYIPNNMEAAAAYFSLTEDLSRYDNVIYFATDDGKARIGMAKNVNIGGNWSIWDQWRLEYYGATAEAYKVWAKNFLAPVETEGKIFTDSYVKAYTAAQNYDKVADKASALEVIKAIGNAADSLLLNIALWDTLQVVAQEAYEVGGNENFDEEYAGQLSDWYADEYDVMMKDEDYSFTNAELIAEIARVRQMITDTRNHPTGKVDYTSMLVNPDFEKGEQGWTGFKTVASQKWNDNQTKNMPTTGGTSSNTCAEAFSSPEFDLYQVVKGAPKGVYEVMVQGFCRNGRGDAAWNNYQNQSTYSQPGKFPVYVYLNNKQTPFKSVFEESKEAGYYKGVNSGSEVYTKNELDFPDGMVSSAIAFSEGMYQNKAYALVANDGDEMRIGVKGTSAGLDGEDDNWVIFDNFRLTWVGFQFDIVKEAIDEELPKIQAKESEKMSKTAHSQLVNVITAVNAAVEAQDGEAAFEQLAKIFDVDVVVSASILKFAPLTEAVSNLEKEIAAAEEAGRQASLQAAYALSNDITGGLRDYKYEDDEVEGLITEINSMIGKLRMPDNVELASDENPVDMTSIIQNPNYDTDTKGWLGTALGYGGDNGQVAEIYNTADGFDTYQDFNGLPAGTYELSVQGFYRAGYSDFDYKHRDSLDLNRACVYGMSYSKAEGDSTMSAKQLMRLNSLTTQTSSEGLPYEYLNWIQKEVDNYICVDSADVEGDMTYLILPNMIISANGEFAKGFFQGNTVTFKLDEGKTMRIGMIKRVGIGNDWCLFDNWKLIYYGANSQKAIDDDESHTAIEDRTAPISVARVEYYTLDGRRAAAAGRGIMIQRTIMNNGAVVIRKVRK